MTRHMNDVTIYADMLYDDGIWNMASLDTQD